MLEPGPDVLRMPKLAAPPWMTAATVVGFAACASAGLGACVSPTLPLPPPDAPVIIPGTDADHVELRAACDGAQPNAIMIIINTNPDVANDLAISGSRASNCGSWDATVYAHANDTLQITQQVGDQASTAVLVTVQ
jgi:hypothetical protein